jgi:hypothetical protein
MVRNVAGRAVRSLGLALAVASCLLTAGLAKAAEALPNDPIATILFLFAKADANQAKSLTTGEFGELVSKGGTPANPNLVFKNIKVVDQDDKSAVVSADLPGERAPSGYVFLARQGGQWKVEALRSLSPPPALLKLVADWRNSTPEQRKTKFKDAAPTGPVDYDRMFAAVELLLKPDRELIAYFNAHKPAFVGLQQQVVKGGLTGEASAASLRQGVATGWSDLPVSKEREGMAASFTDLLLVGGVKASVGAPLRQMPICGADCVMFSLFKVGPNDVGYLWVGPKGSVPDMSPVDFILVEPLGEGWYFYKVI